MKDLTLLVHTKYNEVIDRIGMRMLAKAGIYGDTNVESIKNKLESGGYKIAMSHGPSGDVAYTLYKGDAPIYGFTIEMKIDTEARHKFGTMTASILVKEENFGNE